MTTTSCYSMAPIARSSPITMIALNTMTSLLASIYEPSSVAFDNDTDAYTIVDINFASGGKSFPKLSNIVVTS